MIVKILNESGYKQAMLGLSLSYNKHDIETEQGLRKTKAVARALAGRGCGHDKFMESIAVWMDIKATLKWWDQFDTYRVGVSKQSESTMHTILKHKLTQKDFHFKVRYAQVKQINKLIAANELETALYNLPAGFYYRRIVFTNYKTIYNIISQRKNHKLYEWQSFCSQVLDNIEHKEFFWRLDEKSNNATDSS